MWHYRLMPFLPYLFPDPLPDLQTWERLPPRSSPEYRRGLRIDVVRLIAAGLLALSGAGVVGIEAWKGLGEVTLPIDATSGMPPITETCTIDTASLTGGEDMTLHITFDEEPVGTTTRGRFLWVTQRRTVTSTGTPILATNDEAQSARDLEGGSYAFSITGLPNPGQYDIGIKHDITMTIDAIGTTTKDIEADYCGKVALSVDLNGLREVTILEP